jgi:hypothetical protein
VAERFEAAALKPLATRGIGHFRNSCAHNTVARSITPVGRLASRIAQTVAERIEHETTGAFATFVGSNAAGCLEPRASFELDLVRGSM